MKEREAIEKSLYELDTESLEKTFEKSALSAQIKPENLGEILEILMPMKERLISTYNHSLRVALIAGRIAKFTELDSRPLIISGALHDIGKIKIDEDILNKTEQFTAEDYEKVKEHVQTGFEMMKHKFLYSSEIFLRHHRHSPNPYPEIDIEDEVLSKKEGSKIEEYSRLLALADFYDAISSRNNEKFGDKVITAAQKRELVIASDPTLSEFTRKMYLEGVFV